MCNLYVSTKTTIWSPISWQELSETLNNCYLISFHSFRWLAKCKWRMCAWCDSQEKNLVSSFWGMWWVTVQNETSSQAEMDCFQKLLHRWLPQQSSKRCRQVIFRKLNSIYLQWSDPSHYTNNCGKRNFSKYWLWQTVLVGIGMCWGDLMSWEGH